MPHFGRTWVHMSRNSWKRNEHRLYLSEQGNKVSGSDLQTDNITKYLDLCGDRNIPRSFFIPGKEGVDLLVISSQPYHRIIPKWYVRGNEIFPILILLGKC